MPRIAVPEGTDPLVHLWTRVPALSGPAAAFSGAVYGAATLGLAEFEAARITIAAINDCTLCMNWRSGRDVASRADQAGEIDEAFYAAVLDRRFDGLGERVRLAAEFARRFAVDHLSMDDEFWAELRAAYRDDELVELGLCVGAWIAFGRLNRVMDVDGPCRIPTPSS